MFQLHRLLEGSPCPRQQGRSNRHIFASASIRPSLPEMYHNIIRHDDNDLEMQNGYCV